jgi:hypothetical protein
VARKFRLRVRPGSALHSVPGGPTYLPGDELLVTEREAAQLLRGKGRRAFELLDTVDDDVRRDGNDTGVGESSR